LHLRLGVFALLVATSALATAHPAYAQARKKAAPKAAGVFDDDKSKDKEETTKPKPITDRDTIGFTQENVAAQMTELEERMFRLSEALRGLEPENASRLRLALKFSREEQILEQMRETHKLLKDAQLGKAETEVRELVAKLEHLRNLLLAEDLDFQLKLARLRQMRETLNQLDRIVKEERRELGWARFALDQRKRLERLGGRRPELDNLVKDQQAVLADARKLIDGDDDAAKAARSSLRDRELKVKNAASGLATDPLFADLQPPHLRRADGQLADTVSALDGTSPEPVVAAAEKALDTLREELTRLDDQVTQTEKTIGEAEFKRREFDQAKNRGTADRLAESSARLGDVGVALRKDLIRASVLMKSAEQVLAKSEASSAADEQTAAVDLMGKSREELARSVEKLLVELRGELQARIIADVNEMHEFQSLIRETSQAQAPRVAQKSRSALITLAGMGKKETEIGDRTEHLLALVEETEYGIALPTTLRVFSREMRGIAEWLNKGDVGARSIDMQTRIEQDLIGLLQAVRRLPPTTPPPPGSPLPTENRERERELSRLIAELKMVRMLQARLNDDVIGVDKTRPEKVDLPPEIRREVEALEATQDEIRESLARIAERLPFPEDN
jgi:hypothetical protein